MGLFSTTKPPLTEKNLPDQSGKVFLITGSTGGLGHELAQILYAQNAKVWMAARSEEKAHQVMNDIKKRHPASKGALVFLQLDLNDLTTIKASAEKFLTQETSLHVLWNNAGVMRPPQGSVTKQGYELQLGTNNLAPFLFTKLLTPLLKATAKVSPPDSVRVVWVSSSAAKNFSPDGGLDVTNLDYHVDKGVWPKYGISKAGNIYHGTEYARRFGQDGILSISVDPGFLKTDLYNNLPRWQAPFVNLILHDSIYGAYTELFAGLSTDISMSNNGDFVEPWGKLTPARKDIQLGSKSKEEGGTGIAADFWDWSEKQVAPYV
ncbi:hypothetical protein VTL71DRAFT_5321 [Oculimacula yallundae]|uniref:Short-chain dehydrogenase n=1 Tax=Oculimacula yallundae TaxID=86028 RepID=A0ABR4C1X1_9HELO